MTRPTFILHDEVALGGLVCPSEHLDLNRCRLRGLQLSRPAVSEITYGDIPGHHRLLVGHRGKMVAVVALDLLRTQVHEHVEGQVETLSQLGFDDPGAGRTPTAALRGHDAGQVAGRGRHPQEAATIAGRVAARGH